MSTLCARSRTYTLPPIIAPRRRPWAGNMTQLHSAILCNWKELRFRNTLPSAQVKEEGKVNSVYSMVWQCWEGSEVCAGRSLSHRGSVVVSDNYCEKWLLSSLPSSTWCHILLLGGQKIYMGLFWGRERFCGHLADDIFCCASAGESCYCHCSHAGFQKYWGHRFKFPFGATEFTSEMFD